MKYLAILYCATLIIMSVLDYSWIAVLARDFYFGQIGQLLEFHPLPAALFYVVYIVGVLIFVSARDGANTWKIVARHGALFGFFAYATYDLTNMATLRGWSWTVVFGDVAWGTFNTGFSATCGWLAARRFARS